MKRDVRDRWVADLRSGKYEQHRGNLRGNNDNSFCCLGVLSYCTEPSLSENTDSQSIIYDRMEEMGLTDVNSLWQMNDGSFGDGIPRHSFEEIADYIEKYIPVEN